MSDVSFGYDDYIQARMELIELVNGNLTREDKEFLLSFELGQPDWAKCCAGELSIYPSVQWKLLNIGKLQESNPRKFEQGISKLKDFLQF